MYDYKFELISLKENGLDTDNDPIYITAHRGVTAVAPENTLPAYIKAVELGYYTAECDIQLTKDNVWVLHHNNDLVMFEKEGRIKDYTLEELRTFRYKRGSNCDADGLTICTLDEYLDVFVGTDTRPQIEIKCDNYELLYTVVDAIKSKGLEKSALVISFDLGQLKKIHELNPDIELWYLIGKITQENIDEAKAIGDNVWLSPHYDANDDESIKLALDNEIGVSFWTVDTPEDARRLYNLGVRYIETDILCN